MDNDVVAPRRGIAGLVGRTTSAVRAAASLLVAGAVVVSGATRPAWARPESDRPASAPTAANAIVAADCETYEVSAGDRPSLRIVNLHGTLQVRARRGRLTVTLDGRPVPADRLRAAGVLVDVLSADDRVLFRFGYFPRRDPGPDGQLVHSPTFDPASPHRLLGVTFAEAGAGTAERMGISAAEIVAVSQVCAGGAAESAGLGPGTLLRGDRAAEPFDVTTLAGRLAPGRPLQLRVARATGEGSLVWETMSLTPGPLGAWPSADVVRARFEEIVGR